jgi:hypothetical protein
MLRSYTRQQRFIRQRRMLAFSGEIPLYKYLGLLSLVLNHLLKISRCRD